MAIPTYTALGQRGSWFAVVNDERLPCIHRHWLKGFVYDDPNCEPNGKKWIELIEGLKMTSKAVLTLDRVLDGGKGFVREGYVAVYSIADVELNGSHLQFRLVDKLANLK
jgi:hypothetical protein